VQASIAYRQTGQKFKRVRLYFMAESDWHKPKPHGRTWVVVVVAGVDFSSGAQLGRCASFFGGGGSGVRVSFS
jgi:hypothetical protein